MSMVPCPNGGRCGSRKHRLGTKAYQQCFEQSTSGGGQAKSDMTVPTSVYRPKQSYVEYIGLMETMQQLQAYSAADSFVTKDMVIPEHMVQTYINNPKEVNDLFRDDELEDDIRENIQENSADILAKLGIDEDDLDDGEFDAIIEAARDADNSDIAGAMAKNMGPRTFSYDCVGSCSPRTSEIFDRRYSTYYDGSKEWYSDMAEAYLDDLIGEGWNYSRGDDEEMKADRQAIASALKEALDDNPYINHLPGINVVWSGSLRDVAPNGHSTQSVAIQSPHIVIVDPRGVGPISKPVRLSGEYKVYIPNEERASEGRTSGIRDETPHKLGEIFEQMDNSSQDRPKIKKYKYA